MRKIIIVMLPLLLSTLEAQILNIDREQEFSNSKNSYWLVSGSISKDKQLNDIEYASFYLERGHKLGLPEYGLTMMIKYNGVFSGIQEVQNKGYLQVQYRDFDTRKLSVEPFIQYQWNGLWGLESRFLYGSNLRYRIFDKDGSDTYVSMGLFYQDESWLLGSENLIDKQLRINTVLKSAEKLTEKIDIVNQMFFQMPTNFSKAELDFRLLHHMVIVYAINKQFQLGLNTELFWNNVPLGVTKSWMYGYGANLRFQL